MDSLGDRLHLVSTEMVKRRRKDVCAINVVLSSLQILISFLGDLVLLVLLLTFLLAAIAS